MNKYPSLIFLVMLLAFTVKAQNPDTTKSAGLNSNTLSSTGNDTDAFRSVKPKIKKEKVYHPDSLHSPRTAVIRSLIIPGSGQIYNHSWWKVPVIYATLGTLTYFVVMNADSAKEFLQLAKYRKYDISPKPNGKYYRQYVLYRNVTNQSIYDANDYYRRDRDLSILGIFGFWAINVIDAYIDAKFKNAYSVDNNLSMKAVPDLLNQQMFAQNLNSSFIPGIKITFTF
jgi:hypothetical protein